MEVSEEVKMARVKKRKWKPKYQEGFDPSNPGSPPDPERWLPKRSYRPRRKDKRGQIRGSEGAVVKEKHDSATTLANTASSSTRKDRKDNVSTAKGGSKIVTSSEQQSRTSNRSGKKSRR